MDAIEKEVLRSDKDYLTNDFFFKYAIGSDTEGCQWFRNHLIIVTTDLNVVHTEVLNTSSYPGLDEKLTILDVLAIDENGNRINLELQMYNNTKSESFRFQFYGARMLYEQLEKGGNYKYLKKVYKIILINDDDQDKQLVRTYIMRDDKGLIEENHLIVRVYVNMKVVNYILEEKRRLNLEFTLLEKIVYVFF